MPQQPSSVAGNAPALLAASPRDPTMSLILEQFRRDEKLEYWQRAHDYDDLAKYQALAASRLDYVYGMQLLPPRWLQVMPSFPPPAMEDVDAKTLLWGAIERPDEKRFLWKQYTRELGFGRGPADPMLQCLWDGAHWRSYHPPARSAQEQRALALAKSKAADVAKRKAAAQRAAEQAKRKAEKAAQMEGSLARSQTTGMPVGAVHPGAAGSQRYRKQLPQAVGSAAANGMPVGAAYPMAAGSQRYRGQLPRAVGSTAAEGSATSILQSLGDHDFESRRPHKAPWASEPAAAVARRPAGSPQGFRGRVSGDM